MKRRIAGRYPVAPGVSPWKRGSCQSFTLPRQGKRHGAGRQGMIMISLSLSLPCMRKLHCGILASFCFLSSSGIHAITYSGEKR